MNTARSTAFRDSLYYDKYYPGTTTLKPVEVPVAGLDQNGDPVLPPEYEKLFAEYVAEHGPDDVPPPEDRTISSPNGVGRFEQLFDQPGYAGKLLPGVIPGDGSDLSTRADRRVSAGAEPGLRDHSDTAAADAAGDDRGGPRSAGHAAHR